MKKKDANTHNNQSTEERGRSRQKRSLSTCKDDFITHDRYIYTEKWFKFYKSWHKLHVKIHIWCIFTVNCISIVYVDCDVSAGCCCLSCLVCAFLSNIQWRERREGERKMLDTPAITFYLKWWSSVCWMHLADWNVKWKLPDQRVREKQVSDKGERGKQQTSGAKWPIPCEWIDES